MLLLRGKHLVCSPKNWSAQDKPKTKVLFIGKDPDHGYGSHMYMHTRRMLGKCVELTPEVEMIVYKGRHKDEIEDEYYLDPVIKRAKPLLQVTERKGKEVIVGWVFERPAGGRVFGTTLGYPYKNFQIEAFRRMIVYVILWSAHVAIPKDGAPVNASEEVLALPPKP